MKKIEDMKRENRKLSEEVKLFKAQFSALEGKNSISQQLNETLKREKETLKKDNNLFSEEIQALKKENAVLLKEKGTILQERTLLSTENDTLKEAISKGSLQNKRSFEIVDSLFIFEF